MIKKLLKSLGLIKTNSETYRYPMTYDQLSQIDCMVKTCRFNEGSGKCGNISPAITLNDNGCFICWSEENTTNKIIK